MPSPGHVFLILFRFRLRQVSSSLLDRCALLDEISLTTQAIREVRGIRGSRFNTTVAYVINADARAVGFRRIRRRDSRFDERIGLAELGDENAGLVAAFRAFVAQPHNRALRGAPVALWGRSLHGPLSALAVSSARSLEQLSNNLQGVLRSQVCPAFTSAAVQHSAMQCT